MDSIVSISKKDMNLKKLAEIMGIGYQQLIRYRFNVSKKNGYSSFESFLADYAVERFKERNIES